MKIRFQSRRSNSGLLYPTTLFREKDGTNQVDIVDFSILRSTFGKSSGQPGYDGRADFDANQQVDTLDFSLLRANFGQSGAP